ncbi:unnamed protein product [Cochlearia groenlandica]
MAKPLEAIFPKIIPFARSGLFPPSFDVLLSIMSLPSYQTWNFGVLKNIIEAVKFSCFLLSMNVLTFMASLSYSCWLLCFRRDPSFYVLKEDISPCIFGSIEKQRWSYACAKQLIERLFYAENGLEFTIVIPFNWIGPRMDFIPGIDGPSESVPRVLSCFSNNLLRREPLKLVDGGESLRTFIYIKDAIEAVLLMIENPERANRRIFNVGNPNNEVTVRQLAEMMTKVTTIGSKKLTKKLLGAKILEDHVSGWDPKTSLWDLLESTLTYQHKTYVEVVKKATSKPVAS